MWKRRVVGVKINTLVYKTSTRHRPIYIWHRQAYRICLSNMLGATARKLSFRLFPFILLLIISRQTQLMVIIYFYLFLLIVKIRFKCPQVSRHKSNIFRICLALNNIYKDNDFNIILATSATLTAGFSIGLLNRPVRHLSDTGAPYYIIGYLSNIRDTSRAGNRREQGKNKRDYLQC